jgi:iron complex transport system substrate-binding protein
LKVEKRLIANTIYCKRPEDAKKKEKVGTVIKADIEKIVSLKPDLVLATSLTSPKQVEKLKDLGIRAVVFEYPKNFYELCEDFLELGRIVGKEKTAQRIIGKTKKRVEAIKNSIKGKYCPRVLIQIGSNPLWVAPGDSFINDFIEFAGGINIAKDAKTGLYSIEKVLEQNPDIIIIAEMGIIGEEEKNAWLKIKAMNAVKNNKVYIMDAYKLCSPTPVSFVETLKEIEKILQPKWKILHPN